MMMETILKVIAMMLMDLHYALTWETYAFSHGCRFLVFVMVLGCVL